MAARRRPRGSSFLIPLVLVFLVAQPAAAQSQAVGDLSRSAPYGIPPDEFESLTSDPTASAAFAVPGYNLSAPPGSNPGGNNGSAVDGWRLAVALSADVPLADAGSGVDRSKTTQATTLSLLAPPDLARIDDSWRLCALVFNGLTQDEGGPADGTCTATFLSSECVKQLQVAATAVSDDGKSCAPAGLPSRCAGQFSDNGTSFALDDATVSGQRFFAYGTAPAEPGNSSAVARAEENMWAVVLTWAQLGSDGHLHSANGNVACVRAGNGTGSGGGGGGGGGGGSGTGPAGPTPSPTNPSSSATRSRIDGGLLALVLSVVSIVSLLFV